MYNGALADLNLGTDPWNTNRYTYAGGNPVTRIELDGHVNECLSCGGAGGDASVLAEIQSEPGSTGTTPEPVDTHGVAALDRDSPYDSPVEALQEKVRDRPRPSVTDTVHSLLDSCGLVPLVGEPCDAVNTGWYAAEGDFWNAALSGAALLPIGGQVATAAKLGKRTHDAANTAPGIKVGSMGGESAGKAFPKAVKGAARAENPSTCVYCRMETDSPQIDHVIPRVRGGNATLENAQTTCGWCNPSKSARDFPVNPPPGFRGAWSPEWW